MNENRVTLDQLNILGEKCEINWNKYINNQTIEDLLIKNCDINDDIIKVLDTFANLKCIWFVECDFQITSSFKKPQKIKFSFCKNINNIKFENNIKEIYISDSEKFDLNNIKHLDLVSLKIENVRALNIEVINSFKNLETIYLQDIDEIDFEKKIDFDNLSKLKKVNFDGSKINNKEKLINYFESKKIEISCKEKNLNIG